MRLTDYKRCSPKQESVSFNENEMLLYLKFFNCNFDILRPSRTFNDTWYLPYGRVVSPTTLYKDINYKNPSNLNLLDCGILINL
ncbi:hypothetical protein Avbf_18924 [Armadillidium vulgare]|nr:hypothetical protein Avbf_18924 [Armadillidium vulgare]